MRLYIGTLYSNENEFDECVRSIEAQNYRNFEHFIFKSLPKKEAHDTLFGSFMDKSNRFDLLVKIDADMVLTDRDFLGKVADKFNTHPWLEHLEIAVHDFFSDQLIWGMNIYRNTVQWKKSTENLFTDLVPTNKERKISDSEELAPAAIHCKNPGRFQSFHYGIHKAVKIMQPARNKKKPGHVRYHWDIIQKTFANFGKLNDVRLGLTVLGAEIAFLKRLQPMHLDYTNPIAHTIFLKYAHCDSDAILNEVKRIRKLNWGFLSCGMRRKVISYLEGGNMLHPQSWALLMMGLPGYLKNRWVG